MSESSGTFVPIADLLDILKNGHPNGMVREAAPGEEPDFVQRRDKLCTGVSGRKRSGETFSITFDPPVFLKADTGYVVVLQPIVGGQA